MRLTDAQLALTLSARNTDATALLALYGLPVLPLGIVGEASTDLSAKGTLGGGLATVFDLTGQDFRIGFEGTAGDARTGPVRQGQGQPRCRRHRAMADDDGLGLPGMGTGTATSFAADADFGSGLLVLDRAFRHHQRGGRFRRRHHRHQGRAAASDRRACARRTRSRPDGGDAVRRRGAGRRGQGRSLADACLSRRNR